MKENCEEYPPNTVKEIIYCIQMRLNGNGIYWKLLEKSYEIFAQLYYVLDNVMKDKTAKGLGKVQSATPISTEMEDHMWSMGVLGESNPTQLSHTLLYLLGVNLALRGGDEHKRFKKARVQSTNWYLT